MAANQDLETNNYQVYYCQQNGMVRRRRRRNLSNVYLSEGKVGLIHLTDED